MQQECCHVLNSIINHLTFWYFHRLTLTPATPQACSDTCPVTNVYRGFSTYISNCYCWYDDGLVPPSTNLGGQVFSNWNGVGPVTTVMAQAGASCYKSTHTSSPTEVPSPKPSRKPTVRVHHFAYLSICDICVIINISQYQSNEQSITIAKPF